MTTETIINAQRDIIEYLKNGHISINSIMQFCDGKYLDGYYFDVNEFNDELESDQYEFIYRDSIGFDAVNFSINVFITDPNYNDCSTIEFGLDYNDDIQIEHTQTLHECKFQVRTFDDVDNIFAIQWPKFLRKCYKLISKERIKPYVHSELKHFNLMEFIRQIEKLERK